MQWNRKQTGATGGLSASARSYQHGQASCPWHPALHFSSMVAVALVLMAAPLTRAQDEPQLVEPNRGGELDLKSVDPEVALEYLKTAEGYEISLFASEENFPLANAVSLTFDTKGRLWVATMPGYPQYVPGEPPNDKLLILEDTDGDGRADVHTVFADGLYLPGGFELGDGGAYIAQQPNLIFVKDTDGDDVADQRHVVLHGFGTEDSHHAISAFTWGPGGALYFQEGTFHHTQVETPYGPVRVQDAAVFRYKPRRHRLEVFVSYSFANPWGHVFDRWGQNFIADASGGANYFGSAITGHVNYPDKHRGMKVFTTVVRPTAGCEIVRSRHFPEDAQGNFLVNNCIGFQGIKQHRVIEEGSGFTSEEVEPLLQSFDINFRPVDLQFGPDGALYVVDWFNPLIGHMQYSLRDEQRDHSHGRIWRITYKHKPLVEPPKIAGEPIRALLELLRTYEDRTRYRTRLELRERDPPQVSAELEKWIAGLDPTHEEYEHHLTEALWVYQTTNVVQPEFLRRMLRSPDHHARAAATRVLRYWREEIDRPLDLLRVQANDAHPRVRLEAVVACSFFTTAEAAEVALEALRHSTDYYLDYVLRESMRTLGPYWKPAIAAGEPFAADNPAGVNYVLNQLPTDDLAKVTPNETVYMELLTRHDAQSAHRDQALAGLARLRRSDEITELLRAIRYVDRENAPEVNHILYALARTLAGRDRAELAAVQDELESLAIESNRPVSRQAGYAAMIVAQQSARRAWEMATQSASALRDVVDAVALVPDPELRRSMAPLVEPLLHGLPDSLAEAAAGAVGTRGRYVRIELPGKNRTLTLAEVEVESGGANIAPTGQTSQKSTASSGEAARAIDGNKSGVFGDGGQTHTRQNVQDPWWELDLGSERPIEAVTIWNRSEADGRYAKRLDGFTLTILDAARQAVFTARDNPAPAERVTIEPDADPRALVRRSAIRALSYFPGREAESFGALAEFVLNNTDRAAAVRAMRRIAKYRWPKDQARPLVKSLLAYAAEVPASGRTAPEVLDALQLAGDLAGLLPLVEAQETRAAIAELGVNVIVLRTVPHKMIYDRSRIAVQAGKPVEIILENNDVMPHNLIIAAPGSLAEVGQAAERMSTEPDAFAKHFIPDVSGVLHATRMLATGETERLQFVAPISPGEYPYVCTFPGHWRTMNGVMVVVEDLRKYLQENPLPESVPIVQSRPFVKDWKLDELVSLVSETMRGRSFQHGKELFQAASCTACHRLGDASGASVGPDLRETVRDLEAGKIKPEEFLVEILEPSKVIKEKFRAQIIVTDEGQQITGMVVAEEDGSIRVAMSPLVDAEPKMISLDSIEERVESPISLMPSGLLNTLTKEEIRDLLAYVLSGGDPGHEVFQP